jgi:Pectate lyase superfamily protein
MGKSKDLTRRAATASVFGAGIGAALSISPPLDAKTDCISSFSVWPSLLEAKNQINGQDSRFFWVLGYETAGDGGHGLYVQIEKPLSDIAAIQTRDGRWFALLTQVATPQMFGAKSDGRTDDSGALQRLVDAIYSGNLKARLNLPAGKYHLASTIVVPYGVVGVFEGDGCTDTLPWRRAVLGSATVLMWSGPEGGTLMGGIGNVSYSLRDLAFCGRTSKGAARAGILLHCRQDVTNSMGSGVSLIEQVTFADSAIAVQMGEESSDMNCADFTFIRPTFHTCDVGLLVLNKQGLNYTMIAPTGVHCKSLVTMRHGGHFFATNIQVAKSGSLEEHWLLDFQALGDNADMVSIDGLRCEQSTRQALRCVGGIVNVRAYEEGQNDQKCTMISAFGSQLTIDGARIVSGSSENPHFKLGRGPGGIPATLQLRAVHFDRESFNYREWIGNDEDILSIVQLKDCTYGDLKTPVPITASNNCLSIGVVHLTGATVAFEKTCLSMTGDREPSRGELPFFILGYSGIFTISLYEFDLATGNYEAYQIDCTIINGALRHQNRGSNLPADLVLITLEGNSVRIDVSGRGQSTKWSAQLATKAFF